MIPELKRIRGLLFTDYNNFSTIIDASTKMLWLTEKTKTVYINENLQNFIGVNFGKNLTTSRLSCVHPDDLVAYKKILAEVFKEKVHYEAEYRLKYQRGGYRWIKEEGIAVFFRGEESYKGFLVGCTDSNSQKEIELKLQSSEERYRRLFETARDGILIINSQTGEIEDVNPFLSELLGYSKKEFLGKKLWEVGAFKNIKASKEMFKLLQEAGYVKYDNLPLETSDGRLIEVGFVSNAYLAGGKRVIQCNVRDISEQKRAESAEKALVLLNQEKLKTSFLADVTHELRTPLAIIKGNVELALRSKYDKEIATETFQAINTEVTHLADMISDLSILTEENKNFSQSFEKKVVNLSPTISTVIKRLKKLASLKNIANNIYLG